MNEFTQRQFDRIVTVFAALLLAVSPLSWIQTAHAAAMSNESLTLGTSAPSAVNDHDFRFQHLTAANIGSLQIEYCSNSPLISSPCTAPSGLNTTGTSVIFEAGVTGFTVDPSSSANTVILTRPVGAVAANTIVDLVLSDITNPSTPNNSFFVKITSYSSTDATGPYIDFGAIVASTSGRVGFGGFVPPRITFCVGITVSDRCETVTGSYVDLGDLDSNVTSSGTSQFAVSTNSATGYNVFVTGTTMTSGVNAVASLDAAAASQQGTSQFGFNLRQNTSPVVGQNISGIGTGQIDTDYGVVNQYKFSSGDRIALSSLPTEYNRYTVSYLVNVGENQSPGVYSTTLQYIATAQF